MNWFQNIKNKFSVGLTLAMMLTMIISTGASAAVGIVVNSDADTVADDGLCTLREAITAANSDTASGATIGECAAGAGADFITFAADYTITLVGSQLPAVTSEMTITGNGAANTIIQADAAANTATFRVFEVTSTGNLTLDGVTVRHGRCAGSCNSATDSGGGIYNTGTLNVTDSTLSANTANDAGGGIYNTVGKTTVTDSTLSGNGNTATATTPAGPVSGGGIYNTIGTLEVFNSTLSGNLAATGGGGIFNINGKLTVTNSTLSGNSAISGGGIYNFNGQPSVVTNSTLSGNLAYFGGGIANYSGPLSVTRSLVSGNSAITGTGNELYNGGTMINADAFNVFSHSGQDNTQAYFGFTPGTSDYNATTDGSSKALASILDTTLADNGGPTQTHALVAGSPAIDFAGACGLATDQRGVARPQGVACDAGAFELVTNQPPVANNDSYSMNEDTTLNVFTVGMLGDGVLANDTDADTTEPLTAVRDTWTTNGALTLNRDGTFTYTPNANFCGADSFTYHANDGTADSNIASVDINVVCINNAPVADNDSESTDEDTPVNVDVQANDNAGPSNENQTLVTVTTSNPANGTATINLDGTVTYAPSLNFHGTDTFDYVVCDNGGLCDTATVTITVISVNDMPVAKAGGSYSGIEGSAIVLSGASASDDDGDPLSYSWTVDPPDCVFSDSTNLNPSLTCTTDGIFTVTLTVDDGTETDDDSATVMVITPQQGTEDLMNDIQVLADDGTLKTGQANGLTKPLDNAIRSLDKGNVEDACNQLNDFIVKVEGKTPDPLDTTTAAELIDSAEALKSSIGCQ